MVNPPRTHRSKFTEPWKPGDRIRCDLSYEQMLQDPPWNKTHHQGSVITDPIICGTRQFMFDPPNVLMPAGGMRVRIIDPTGDTPSFQMELFQRDANGKNVISNHPGRWEPTHPAPQSKDEAHE